MASELGDSVKKVSDPQELVWVRDQLFEAYDEVRESGGKDAEATWLRIGWVLSGLDYETPRIREDTAEVFLDDQETMLNRTYALWGLASFDILGNFSEEEQLELAEAALTWLADPKDRSEINNHGARERLLNFLSRLDVVAEDTVDVLLDFLYRFRRQEDLFECASQTLQSVAAIDPAFVYPQLVSVAFDPQTQKARRAHALQGLAYFPRDRFDIGERLAWSNQVLALLGNAEAKDYSKAGDHFVGQALGFVSALGVTEPAVVEKLVEFADDHRGRSSWVTATFNTVAELAREQPQATYRDFAKLLVEGKTPEDRKNALHVLTRSPDTVYHGPDAVFSRDDKIDLAAFTLEQLRQQNTETVDLLLVVFLGALGIAQPESVRTLTNLSDRVYEDPEDAVAATALMALGNMRDLDLATRYLVEVRHTLGKPGAKEAAAQLVRKIPHTTNYDHSKDEHLPTIAVMEEVEKRLPQESDVAEVFERTRGFISEGRVVLSRMAITGGGNLLLHKHPPASFHRQLYRLTGGSTEHVIYFSQETQALLEKLPEEPTAIDILPFAVRLTYALTFVDYVERYAEGEITEPASYLEVALEATENQAVVALSLVGEAKNIPLDTDAGRAIFLLADAYEKKVRAEEGLTEASVESEKREAARRRLNWQRTVRLLRDNREIVYHGDPETLAKLADAKTLSEQINDIGDRILGAQEKYKEFDIEMLAYLTRLYTVAEVFLVLERGLPADLEPDSYESRRVRHPLYRYRNVYNFVAMGIDAEKAGEWAEEVKKMLVARTSDPKLVSMDVNDLIWSLSGQI